MKKLIEKFIKASFFKNIQGTLAKKIFDYKNLKNFNSKGVETLTTKDFIKEKKTLFNYLQKVFKKKSEESILTNGLNTDLNNSLSNLEEQFIEVSGLATFPNNILNLMQKD